MGELRGKNICEVVEDMRGSKGPQRQAQPHPQGCLPVPLLLARLSKQTSQVHGQLQTSSVQPAEGGVSARCLPLVVPATYRQCVASHRKNRAYITHVRVFVSLQLLAALPHSVSVWHLVRQLLPRATAQGASLVEWL